MPRDKQNHQRRVYVLPDLLVQQIAEYQKEKGLPSEVDAVRGLLDKALSQAETPGELTKRAQRRIDMGMSLTDAARDILVGHPVVAGITFEETVLRASFKDGSSANLHAATRPPAPRK